MKISNIPNTLLKRNEESLNLDGFPIGRASAFCAMSTLASFPFELEKNKFNFLRQHYKSEGGVNI